MSKRVVFTFDERSLESLQDFTAKGRYSSMAEAVRDSLRITLALQRQQQDGFTDLIVRRPDGSERIILAPKLT